MKQITLKEDFCFKEVMENETVRKHFIGDVLDIPVEKIKSVRVRNPHLWRRRRQQKEGVLDLLLELNDDTKIFVEIQIRPQADWKKRTVFYLAKVYVEDLVRGERYEKAKKCVAITIVDFNLDERENYHNVYRLRDRDGVDYTDELELHTIELKKKPKSDMPSPLDEWHNLFNAETEEERNMLKAKTSNPGIIETVRIIHELGLSKILRAERERRWKAENDRYAEDKYVFLKGKEEGIVTGIAKGKAEAIIELLEDCGDVSEALKQMIYAQEDLETLKAWHKLAARAESVEAFARELATAKQSE